MEVVGRAEQGGGQGVIVCIVEHAELLVQRRDSDQVERRRMFLHVANAANCVRMEREYAGTKQGIEVGKTDAKRICQSRPEPRLRLGHIPRKGLPRHRHGRSCDTAERL